METTFRSYYPSYMRRKRKHLTDEQVRQDDNIRNTLIRYADDPDFEVSLYTDNKGRERARIGRKDGRGMGFSISPELGRELLNRTTSR